MALEVPGNTFYLVRLPEGKTLHNSEESAINQLQNNADDVDPESSEVDIVKISVENDDWTIAEMSWQNIALQLMGE